MRLKLERPIAFFDLETTGVRIGADRIVQIGVVVLHADGSRTTWKSLVHPGIPIPPEATAIHRITDADVAGAPALDDLADELLERLAGCDLGGFNCLRFDVPMLAEELHRVGRSWDTSALRIVDVQRIFHKMEPRDLSAAVRYYLGGELIGAHDALADVEATADVLLAQLERYPDLPADVDQLGEFSGDRDRSPDPAGKLAFDASGNICLSFGKYRGWPLEQVGRNDPGYLQWLLTKAELPGSTLAVMKGALADIQA
ncbi:MAG: 3'-5' exonuclease [Flavobacteriales bacterium]|nr:3'-5' exonuclease [Flavobacteriales bacterium]MCB9168644.1 3'-5' exonuclease [Flavobacteriales bacterium]